MIELPIYDLAQKFYQNNINSSKGKKAKEYLHNRSISDEIIKDGTKYKYQSK